MEAVETVETAVSSWPVGSSLTGSALIVSSLTVVLDSALMLLRPSSSSALKLEGISEKLSSLRFLLLGPAEGEALRRIEGVGVSRMLETVVPPLWLWWIPWNFIRRS